MHWFRTCKSTAGLSIKDIETLLKDVLFHPQFKLEEVTIRSAADVEKFEEPLYSEADDWQEHHIRGHLLRFREPISALTSLFSTEKVAEGFELEPATQNPIRVYSTPASGTWWHAMQVRKILLNS